MVQEDGQYLHAVQRTLVSTEVHKGNTEVNSQHALQTRVMAKTRTIHSEERHGSVKTGWQEKFCKEPKESLASTCVEQTSSFY